MEHARTCYVRALLPVRILLAHYGENLLPRGEGLQVTHIGPPDGDDAL